MTAVLDHPGSDRADTLTIALAGNPNSGKTALFNALTGVRQRTGNWPGVTVERKQGRLDIAGLHAHVVDLPGIYSFDEASLDQRIARDALLSDDIDIFVNVVDASNLERHLYLTVQLLEMNVPVVVALNMVDVAERDDTHVDVDALAAALGCRVVALVATQRRGLDELRAAIRTTAGSMSPTGRAPTFDLPAEQIVDRLAEVIASASDSAGARPRWTAIKLLEGDERLWHAVGPDLRSEVIANRSAFEARVGQEADIHIADHRFTTAHDIATSVTARTVRPGETTSDHIDRVVLHRWLGIPIFLAVMYTMFTFTINIGGAFIDVFDGLAGAVFVDGFREVLETIGTPVWAQVVLADGVGGGLQVVATFIPVIGALYLFMSILEDSGYMARAAFVMDRAMRAIGLPGRAFVPMVVGFGCNVPAIMATRTLERERERKLTILMNPFMSCGARLPVYALFAAAFFPTGGQNVVFVLYVIGILVAIATGLVMKRSLLPGETESFVMELPAYHRPTLRGMALRSWDRVSVFIRSAGKVIVLMVTVLALLNSVGTDGSFGNEDTDASVLSAVGRTITPVFEPMGVDEDNWPATVGIFTGVLAKEAVVGTLDSLYGGLAHDGAAAVEPGDEPFDFGAAVGDSMATVPENLRGVVDTLTDPLGLGVGAVSSIEAAADEQEVDTDVFGAMRERFDGRNAAFAYLLFVLLYFPCVATIGAIVREAGRSWALFVAAWSTGIAYLVATFFYQATLLDESPLASVAWMLLLTLAAVGVVIGLRTWAGRESHATRPLPEVGR